MNKSPHRVQLTSGPFAGDLGTVIDRTQGPDQLPRLVAVADSDPDKAKVAYPPWQTVPFVGRSAARIPPENAAWIRAHVLNRHRPQIYRWAGMTTCQAHLPRPVCAHCRSRLCTLCTGRSWGELHAATIRNRSGSDLFWRDEHRYLDGLDRCRVWIAPRTCRCACRAADSQATTPPTPPTPSVYHSARHQAAVHAHRPRDREPLDGQIAIF